MNENNNHHTKHHLHHLKKANVLNKLLIIIRYINIFPINEDIYPIKYNIVNFRFNEKLYILALTENYI